MARSRRRLEDAEAELREQRRRARSRSDRLKQENADLRRKLGDTRTRLRQAEERRTRGRSDRRRRLAAAAAGPAAPPRPRYAGCAARVSELEGEAAAPGAPSRAQGGRDGARQAARRHARRGGQGLRRELGLPAVERLPADTVAAARRRGGRAGSRRAAGRCPSTTPRSSRSCCGCPGAHLVVDGYNVTKNAWPELPLERQRDRLLTGAAALLAARTGAEMTVVFDAAETQDRPLVSPPRGVRVLFSPFGVIADDVIRDLVAAEPPGRAVVVVSSDQEVARDVEQAGFRVVASAALRGAAPARRHLIARHQSGASRRAAMMPVRDLSEASSTLGRGRANRVRRDTGGAR